MFIKALLVGIFYWKAKWPIGYTFGVRWCNVPMIMAPVLGLIMGNVKDAIILGAYIQAVYLGIVSGLGGVVTVDKALATCITIPIALQANIPPEVAVTLAIPFGLLGTLTSNLYKLFMTYCTHLADKAAEEGNAHKIRMLAFVAPSIGWFPLTLIPVTAIVWLGPDAVQAFLELIPSQVIAGLTAVGGLLPALGFAMTIRVIGRKSFLPFFFLGYFFVKYFAISTIGAAIFGGIAAIVYIQLMGGNMNATATNE